MLHALYANAGGGHARQGIEKHPAQGVAQRLTKTALQGIYDEFAIAVVVAYFHPFDFRDVYKRQQRGLCDWPMDYAAGGNFAARPGC